MSRVKLIAVGDICLQTRNNEDPFYKVRDILKNKDIFFGNIETVLSNKRKKAEKAVLLYSSPEKVGYLKNAGFNVLNIANNHIMDLGLEGFNETLEVLNRNNLLFIGAGNRKFNQSYVVIESKGIKFSFLGYYESGFKNSKESVFINKIDKDNIVADIRKIKLQSDIVVISLHWGIENVFYPSPKQIDLAHKLIDSGATIILGHHPHVVQGIEKYKNGLIVYSLGNFQFKAERERNKKSIILSVEISKSGIERYEIIPVRINENFLPCIMDDKKRREMLSSIDAISRPITEDRIDENWWFEEIAYEHLRGNMQAWIIRIKRYGIRHFYSALNGLFLHSLLSVI